MVALSKRPRTIISDIDGTLLPHEGSMDKQHLLSLKPLPGVLDKFKYWDLEGCRIILMTGRRESTRAATEKQLEQAGIFYDQLIMGVTGGVRILINDRKLDSLEDTALAVVVDRNKGLEDIKV